MCDLSDNGKLLNLLELKYKALADAKKSLGKISDIRNIFIGVQMLLYQKGVSLKKEILAFGVTTH